MASLPGQYNFPPIVRGDTFGIATLGGIVGYHFSINVDLTDYKIKMWIKANACSGGPSKELSTESQGITIDGPDPDVIGNYRFTIQPFTFNLPAGTCYYDIQFTSPPGENGRTDVNTFIKGQITVINDITQ